MAAAPNKAFLPPALQEDLIDLLVAHGNNYEMYLGWCNENEIPEDRRFTRYSLRQWGFRRIKVIREKREAMLSAHSLLDRAKRLQALEESFARVEQFIVRNLEVCTGVELVRLEEQKRKVLLQIAQERGEWGVTPDDDTESMKAQRSLATHFQEYENKKRELAAQKKEYMDNA